jgi:hypothetical protein
MTKTKIIKELRRSALEDKKPLHQMAFSAWSQQCDWRDRGEWFYPWEDQDLRTFLLLVACALEDE